VREVQELLVDNMVRVTALKGSKGSEKSFILSCSAARALEFEGLVVIRIFRL
jgi:hypothetical protein